TGACPRCNTSQHSDPLGRPPGRTQSGRGVLRPHTATATRLPPNPLAPTQTAPHPGKGLVGGLGDALGAGGAPPPYPLCQLQRALPRAPAPQCRDRTTPGRPDRPLCRAVAGAGPAAISPAPCRCRCVHALGRPGGPLCRAVAGAYPAAL